MKTFELDDESVGAILCFLTVTRNKLRDNLQHWRQRALQAKGHDRSSFSCIYKNTLEEIEQVEKLIEIFSGGKSLI